MPSKKLHRDGLSGQYITQKSAKKRPARSVAEPRTRRKAEAVAARFAVLVDADVAVVCVGEGEEVIHVPLKAIPKGVGVGEDMVLRFERA